MHMYINYVLKETQSISQTNCRMGGASPLFFRQVRDHRQTEKRSSAQDGIHKFAIYPCWLMQFCWGCTIQIYPIYIYIYTHILVCVYIYMYMDILGMITVHELGNPFLTSQYKRTTEGFEYSSCDIMPY